MSNRSKKLLSVVGFVALWVIVWWLSPGKNTAADYVDSGVAHYNSGEYEKAIDEYNRAIELNPNYAPAYNNRGLAYYDQGMYSSAIADYTRAIQLSPNDTIAYYNRGNTYYDRENAYTDQGNYNLAIADYTRAIQLDPNHVNSHQNLGNVYYDQERYSESLPYYRRYLQLAGDEAEQWVIDRVAELEDMLDE